MNDEEKPDRPVALDMDFGEALARFAQTKPEEVEPAPGQKKKAARPQTGRFADPAVAPAVSRRNTPTRPVRTRQ